MIQHFSDSQHSRSLLRLLECSIVSLLSCSCSSSSLICSIVSLFMSFLCSFKCSLMSLLMLRSVITGVVTFLLVLLVPHGLFTHPAPHHGIKCRTSPGTNT